MNTKSPGNVSPRTHQRPAIRLGLGGLLFLLWITATTAQADIVFTISQDPSTPGPVVVGDTAIFNISIASNSGTINNLGGVDFFVDAHDPALTGTNIAAGQFTGGASLLFGSYEGAYVLPFVPSGSYQIFSAHSNVGLTLTDTPTHVASVILDTTGATPGTYTMSVSSVFAVDPTYNELTSLAGAPLNYVLEAAAVPEPSPLLLVCSTALLAAAWNRMRLFPQHLRREEN